MDSKLDVSSSTNIKVIARHNKACRKSHPDYTLDYRKCNCRKAIYIYENGQDTVISAKTRSWDEAERLAQEHKDLRDPVKRRLKEIEEEREAEKAAVAEAEKAAAAAKAAKNLSLEDATGRWLNAQKADKERTAMAHNGAVNRILAWAEDNNIRTVADVTADELDKWRGEWKPIAEKPYNRIGPTTQQHFQGYLKSFFKYIVGLGFLEKDPAAGLPPIRINVEPTQPLSADQFKELLAAIEPFCANESGILHGLAAEFDALFSFQRWTGLRIGDAVAFPRAGLKGNRITLTTQKTGVLINGRIIPDDVASKLATLSEDRPGFRKGYFFWREGISTIDSLKATWIGYIIRLNAALHFTNELGEAMSFHSHMLRDTYAVQLLLQGVSLEKVSRLLTHDSIATTEKHYAPWVKERLEQLENDSVEAMRRMGMIVTVNPPERGLQCDPPQSADAQPAQGVTSKQWYYAQLRWAVMVEGEEGLREWKEAVQIFPSENRQTALRKALELGWERERVNHERDLVVKTKLAEIVRLDCLGSNPAQIEVTLSSCGAPESLPFEHNFHPEENLPELCLNAN